MNRTMKKKYSAPTIAIEDYEVSSLLVSSLEVNRDAVVEDPSEILSRRHNDIWSDDDEDF